MTTDQIAAVILAAGLGTRMKSDRPKVLHPLAGRPLIGHVLAQLATLKPARVALVVGPGMDSVVAAAQAAAPEVKIVPVVQRQRLGTGHAALQARSALAGFKGEVLVLNGDGPLLTADTLARMAAARRLAGDPAVVVLGFRPADPGPYGRMVTGPRGALERIVEARDASPAERQIDLCNSGVMAFDGRAMFDLLSRIRPDNAKREYYLTDVVAAARAAGRAAAYVEGPAEELLGINSRADLAVAEAIIQTRLRGAAMAGGATLLDPATVWFSHDTRLGRDVTIGPSVFFGPGVSVADGAEIRAFCHLEG
ncbi:MAG: NTP transferase domain-containing protein, partial [Rhodospirillales bacterium]|nr:NTP transferase domain-containing protein [Rhodospirillales bacterium]